MSVLLGTNPSFVGIGFVDAYQATANNVVFGNSRSAALQNYLTQLSGESTVNGSSPEQGGQVQTVTGKIAAVGWDITGGQKYWYITLAGDPRHVYVGTVSSVGPSLVLASRSPETMLETFHWFRASGGPRSRAGARCCGSRIAGRTSDPDRALRNLLERDRMFTGRRRDEAGRLGLPVIDVDVAMTEDGLVERVAEAFGLRGRR
jgi:hypothetical protein